MQYYRVGGAVRDRLLGRESADVDYVVVGGSVEELLALGFKPVGHAFPVFLHPDTHEQYALARTERKVGIGYKGFQVHASQSVSLEEDLKRRDLTINAMAENIDDERLIDPFGGEHDLKQKILRHVSPAFVEDPLRVLRVARFAARLDFTIADETLALMREISQSGELKALAAERIWAETERALAEEYPRRFIEVLRECGALAVLFPELDKLFGIPQNKHYHPEVDTGLHTLMALEQSAKLSTDTRIRFATLVHDLGKGETPKEEWPSHRGHDKRGVNIIENLCRRLCVPNEYRQLAALVSRFHIDCHRIMEMRPETVLSKLEKMDAFRNPTRLRQFLQVCLADIRGRLGHEDNDYPQAYYLEAALSYCKEVDAGKLAKQGLDTPKFVAELRTQRVKKLEKLKTLQVN